MTPEPASAGSDRTIVGFVGLGNMGMPMARRLAAAGYRVRGFDTSAEAMRKFAAIGSRVVHAGDTGAGHAVKVLTNLMSAAHRHGRQPGPSYRPTPTTPRSPGGSTSGRDGDGAQGPRTT